MPETDNIRYRDLEVNDGVFVPQPETDFPEDNPYKKLYPAKHLRELVFDENYTYLDKSFSFKFQRWIGYTFLVDFMIPLVNHTKFGLRVRGRKNLKKYRKELANGAITICNHCYRWDAPCVINALHFKKIWIPVYGDNLNGKDYWHIKHVGGIPVPDNMGGLKKFNQAFDELHEKKQWFHVFPEESRWNFYKPLRPFRKGAFTMAYKYNMPIVPMCITFRERKGIYKLLGKASEPLLTITIGEPIFPNTQNHRKDEVDRLLHLSHSTLLNLAGISKNSWPAFINEE
ncbi:MAG: 1-acyl-sn-glycerol-3-phosphate acyltransferase [Bacteroidales bacterium]|nr:1-acyl-sn-glycerol-3-phosphate acyltransferase [Bacteroidales bacterium]